MKNFQAEFGNLLCHFGPKKVLSDYLNEIILPAFFQKDLRRTRGQSPSAEYLFYEVELIKLGQHDDVPIVAVVGRIVKNTRLIRTQIYDEKRGLIEDRDSIASAPSAVFLLILNTHEIVYLHQTPGAPKLSVFEMTLRVFINKTYNAHLELLRADADGEIVFTKAQVKKIVPAPTTKIVPLVDRESIVSFVGRFKRLTSLSFELLRPNANLDAEKFLADTREGGEKLNGSSTKVVIKNPKQSLDLEEVVNIAEEAGREGNTKLQMIGTDYQDNTIRGTNDDFKIVTLLQDIPKSITEVAKLLYEQFLKSIGLNSERVQESADGIRKITKQ